MPTDAACTCFNSTAGTKRLRVLGKYATKCVQQRQQNCTKLVLRLKPLTMSLLETDSLPHMYVCSNINLLSLRSQMSKCGRNAQLKS